MIRLWYLEISDFGGRNSGLQSIVSTKKKSPDGESDVWCEAFGY